MLMTKRVALTTGGLLAAVAAVVGAAAAGHASDRPQNHPSGSASHALPIPPQLQVPDGNQRIATLDARGVQTYTCASGAWTLLEPAATLWNRHDPRHRPVALHTRGPVWISTRDGSAVNASAVPGASVPRDHSVPELLLKATATRGDGIFGAVSYVQRLNTAGGVAPSGTCTQGAQTSVPYSATYLFYAPAD
ncbi:DUF3455 domain-containing protein [Streptomyces sp. NPDC007905]|uniref:DUF3455 domain-containing protein n=1 Tax=Streptomyces sp. NPDC007905 TaxID=3364788 RepID=UPI0036E354D1